MCTEGFISVNSANFVSEPPPPHNTTKEKKIPQTFFFPSIIASSSSLDFFAIGVATHNCCNLLPGEDLLAIAADQPFRFPATFTFVVRAFSGNV